MASQLLAKKPLNAILAEASETGEHSLRRSLGPVNLVTLGIGAIIGTGIFVLTGPVAATAAGPAIVLSFIIAGIGCAFGGATVAVGWGGYVCSFLQDLGIPFPAALSYAPGTVLAQYQGRWEPVMSLPHAAVPIMSSLPHATSHFDLVALVGILAVTAILVKGIKESANINSAIVIVKVSVLLIFIGLGVAFLAAHRAIAPLTGIPSFRLTRATSANSAGPVSCAARESSSSLTLVSTRFLPQRRRPGIPLATCPSASSAR